MTLTLPISAENMHRIVDEVVAVLDQAPPGPSGVVRIEVLTGSGASCATVRFDPASVVADDRAEPDAVLRIALEDLTQWLDGGTDGALLYLADRLEVLGDEQLVLSLGTTLRMPGSDRTLIDPAALDPLAVSAAIAEVSPAHLARVMSSGFRDLVLGEVFRRLPGFLIAEKADRVRLAVMFEIEREDSTALDRYVVRVADGACTVQAGAGEQEPVDATVVLTGNEFLRLVLGHLNPVRGVLSGEIRVRGQVLKALGFNSVMQIPGS